MDARHRIGIIAAAVGLAVATLGGRATASVPPPAPDTHLGVVAQACIDIRDIAPTDFTFYDGGPLRLQGGDGEICICDALGIPNGSGR